MRKTTRTSGHYDALKDEADFANVVVHAPVVENLCHVGGHTDAAVLA
jgi:hypothetical protein